MSAALIVFAKAPVAGQAKTRLIPALGAEGAANMAEKLLMHTLQQACDLSVEHLELCVSPDALHPAFERAQSAAQGRLHLAVQGSGDLGERMHRALTRTLTLHSKGLLIGTDAPALTTPMLLMALQALDHHDAVFVPALDGGYALVGLRRPAPTLFLGMTWSTPQVMAQTRERARLAGLQWAELAPVADIDEPSDLAHLPKGWLS
jgi:rSAM/selenodomain-associated transferase 1